MEEGRERNLRKGRKEDREGGLTKGEKGERIRMGRRECERKMEREKRETC